ncbi:MAG: carbonic anhydrase family protein [bacterium]
MNHFIKQSLAWFMAFGLSTGSLAGGYYLMTRHYEKGDNSTATSPGSSHADESQEQPIKHLIASEHTPIHDGEFPAPHDTASQTMEHTHAISEHDTVIHAKKDTENHAKKHTEEHDQEPTEPHSESHPRWSYLKSAVDGPNHWSALSENFSACSEGTQQSPIDINDLAFSHSTPELRFNYGRAKLHLQNNGHTIQGRPVGEGQHYVTIGDKKYDLAQFHFHSPSEHSIAGIPSDIELHFVHKNASGELAVVAVLINESSRRESSEFKSIWQTLPRSVNSETSTSQQIRLSSLLPKGSAYAHYQGSLTTPPCIEGVQWFVLTTPMAMSSGQVETYSSIFQGPTNRPRQPVKDRKLLTNSPQAQAH